MDKNLKIILQKEKLENLLPLFTNQNITDSILPDLNDECLVDLGIEKMGDRQRLLSVFRHVSEQFAYGGSFMVKIVGGTLPYDSMMTGQKVDAFLIAKYPVMLAEWERVKVWGGACQSGGVCYKFKSGEAEGCHTKSSLLLDFRKGAQCVPPVCVGVLLGCDGQSASKWPSLKTAETAVPPSFALAKSNFKVTKVSGPCCKGEVV